MTAQPLSSLRLCSCEPLTDCSFAHPQRYRDVFLLPPLLPQLPGSQASTFFPIVWFVFFLHPSILSGLAIHATVYSSGPGMGRRDFLFMFVSINPGETRETPMPRR